MQEAFRRHFGAEWSEVLMAADLSVAYHAANSAYIAVRDLRPAENLTLEQLLEKQGIARPVNIIAG